MANTVQITLEVDDQGTVKIADFQKKATESTEAVAESSKKMGERGRLGFFALGNAIEDSARSMGVAGQASRQLGNSVERMAASALPAFGTAIGLATLAVTAGVAMWRQYEEGKRKAAEETAKNVEALKGEIAALYGGEITSAALTGAQRDLLKAKRDLFLLESERKIADETEALGEQKLAIINLKEKIAGMYNESGELRRDDAVGMERQADAMKALEKATLTAAISEKTLAAETAFRKAVQGQKESTDDRQTEIYEFLENMDKASKERRIGIENDFQTAKLEVMRASGFGEQEILNQELSMLDFHYAQKIARAEQAGATETELNRIKDERAIVSALKHNEGIKKIDQMALAQKAAMMGGVGQVMDQLYTLTGNKMKVFFYLSKAAAASEAFFQYKLAAAKAAGQAGIFGLPMEAYFTAMSYIVPPLIMASAFTGPSGGSANAGNVDISATTPASSPEPATQPAPVQDVHNYHFYGTVIGDLTEAARTLAPAIRTAESEGA